MANEIRDFLNQIPTVKKDWRSDWKDAAALKTDWRQDWGDLDFPQNTAIPTVSGSPRVGQTLTVTTGTWAGGQLQYSYQWIFYGAAGWTNIVNGTQSSCVVTAAQLTYQVGCNVMATNNVGANEVLSTLTAAIQPA